MGVVIAVPKYAKIGEGFSRREQIAALEHPGRRADGVQTAASWVSDLTALRKAIILCSFCRVKFNPGRHHYRRFYAPDSSGSTDGYMHNGRCDGCRQQTAMIPGGGTTFISEESYRLLCLDPLDARRRARAAAGMQTAWERVSSMFTRWGSRQPREVAAGGAR